MNKAGERKRLSGWTRENGGWIVVRSSGGRGVSPEGKEVV